MLYVKKMALFFLLAVFIVASSANAQEVLLIANPDVPVDSLTAGDVKLIFLGNKTDWGNGNKITFFTAKEDAAQDAFLGAYVGKTSSQYNTYWKKQVFTGKGKTPQSAGSDQDMVGMVTSTGGAIGYISAGADPGSAKIISVK